MQDVVFEVPPAIRAEHAELHASLARAIRYPGKVGEAARALAARLHPHSLREEQVALRPLGLLPALARGEFVPGMEHVRPMTDALRQELPQMLREHQEIVAAAQRLAEVARSARAADVSRFAQAVLAHIRLEEEVLYPAAIVVGDLVRAQERVPA